MAVAYDKKEIAPEFSNEEALVRSLYEYSRDGGAVGTFELFEANKDCVVTHFHAYVKEAVTSAGSATVIIGQTGDDDSLVTSKLQAALTIGTLLKEDGAAVLPIKLAAGDKIYMTVGVAALTAGKIDCVIKYVKA